MTGWQVLAAVRARDPRMPVIIITGSPVYADDRCIVQPGVLLVRKPARTAVTIYGTPPSIPRNTTAAMMSIAPNQIPTMTRSVRFIIHVEVQQTTCQRTHTLW